jgi:hypothetical protein
VLGRDGLLVDPPPKGAALIPPARRSRSGRELLYALLFGEEDAGVRLERVERELLTVRQRHRRRPELVNNLEVNEQVLYARMENVEESTLE